MKKYIAILLALSVVLAASVPAFAAEVSIRKVEYEGAGRVEVDFDGYVQYENVEVIVNDDSGKNYLTEIRELDGDDLSFKVSDIAAGQSYSFVISGVRSGKTGSYASVQGSFEVPPAKTLAIRSLDYDREDRELEIDFNARVQYEDLKVLVKDASGQSYSVKVRDMDDDSVEVRVSGLKRGESYSVEVSGVRADGMNDIDIVSGNFEVR